MSDMEQFANLPSQPSDSGSEGDKKPKVEKSAPAIEPRFSPAEVMSTVYGQNNMNKANLSGPINATAGNIIANVNEQLIGQYMTKMEEAKQILQSYMGILEDLDKKMSKASPQMRKSLGEAKLYKQMDAVEETYRKVEAHQNSTIKRLMS